MFRQTLSCLACFTLLHGRHLSCSTEHYRGLCPSHLTTDFWSSHMHSFSLYFRFLSTHMITRLFIGMVCISVLNNDFFFFCWLKCILWVLKWPTVVSDTTEFSKLWCTCGCVSVWPRSSWHMFMKEKKKKRITGKGKIPVYYLIFFFFVHEIIVTLTLLYFTRDSSDFWSYQSRWVEGWADELDTRWQPPGKRSNNGIEFWPEINILQDSVASYLPKNDNNM
jgi:hypothetical protein